MRIAQLANFVGPTSGGMKVVIDHLGAGYVAAGHDRIFVRPGARDRVVETPTGLEVSVAAPRVSGHYRMISKPWRALEVLERFGPTSIEVSDKWTLSPAGRWARRRGIGAVLFSHERLREMTTQWLRHSLGVAPVVHAMNKRLAKSFDAVVVTSRYAAEEFAGTSAAVELVPLGVDCDTFQPGAPMRDGVLKLVYVGRLSREKMPLLAVQTAVALHRRGRAVRLDVYGAGPHAAELQAAAAGAPVFFHGFVANRRDVASHYAAADISLSVSPTETFGLAVLEALASGTPVVTSSQGGGRELITEECGAWAPPDPELLADAVENLAARLGPERRAAARAQAQRYTWQHTVDSMLAIHRRLRLDDWRD